MWNDLVFAFTFISIVMLGGFALHRMWGSGPPRCHPEPELDVEAYLDAHELTPDHFYLFVYDARAVSMAYVNKVCTMLHENGIHSGFLRVRGAAPIVYDLKRPEKGIENE